ncbi:MAG: nicotinate-nucleotide--dimethylbenzimidazole phosphoribosyltransferase [Alphaproteobacteria bacterium]
MKSAPAAIGTSYQDILQVLPQLPPPDLAAATAAMGGAASPETREPRGWLARWQGKASPQLRHPRLSLFAANHGIGAVWRAPVAAKDAIAPVLKKEGVLVEMAVKADCDLRLYEMNLATPTRSFTAAAAMDEAEVVKAISYGMAAVDMGLDLLALGSCGDGQELAAAVIISGVTGQPVMALAAKLGISLHVAAQIAGAAERAQAMDGCALLQNFGGPEIAALLGAMIAARMAHTPVLVADWGGLAALCLLDKLDRRASQHVALGGALCKHNILPEHQKLMFGKESALGVAATECLIALRSVV